jgi:MFS family permease
VRNWSVIFMRDSFVAPAWVDTLALPAFIGATVIGRLLADQFITRYGPVRFARALGLVSLFGLALVVLSHNLTIALLGFAWVGLGVCVSFPLSTSAAARLGDRPASENVAALTMTTQITLLGAPALLGYVASTFGIRSIFIVVVPVVVAAVFLARYLEPKRGVKAA